MTYEEYKSTAGEVKQAAVDAHVNHIACGRISSFMCFLKEFIRERYINEHKYGVNIGDSVIVRYRVHNDNTDISCYVKGTVKMFFIRKKDGAVAVLVERGKKVITIGSREGIDIIDIEKV